MTITKPFPVLIDPIIIAFTYTNTIMEKGGGLHVWFGSLIFTRFLYVSVYMSVLLVVCKLENMFVYSILYSFCCVFLWHVVFIVMLSNSFGDCQRFQSKCMLNNFSLWVVQ